MFIKFGTKKTNEEKFTDVVRATIAAKVRLKAEILLHN